MAITTINPGSNQRPTFTPRTPEAQGFAALLASQGNSAPAQQGEAQPTVPPLLPTDGQAPAALIPLGEINEAAPSVSHLLQNHPELREQCWQIVFAAVNQDKQFTTLRPGVQVSLNPHTKELVWSKAGPSRPEPLPERPQPPAKADEGRITLGTIGPAAPTISHLLQGDPRFQAQTWEIIFSAVNRDKPYSSLKPGSLVAIDPHTLELSFPAQTPSPAPGRSRPAPPAQLASEARPTPTVEQREFAAKLTASVRSYLGQPYRSLDCYGLVVRGLKDQGVQYSGENGLRQQLERSAREQGLPRNALQNGEGLIEIAGHKVFDHSFVRVTDAERQAREVLHRLTPLLQEGMLLSFSTPSRGHTGVIAHKEGVWTYVNSGVIDHEVAGRAVSKRVGEETLAAEIKNWLQLAQENATSLKVSAGLFDTQRLKPTASLTAAGGEAPGAGSGGGEG